MSEQKNLEEMLAMLRCPIDVHEDGEDPGQLRLVKDVWLVCDEGGHKFPIYDGIPIMLSEVGEQYADTPEEELPVPPPPMEDEQADDE